VRKDTWLFRAAILASVALGLLIAAREAAAQTKRIGQTFEEIEKLAKEEGIVRLGSLLRRENVAVVLGEFQKKYPEIKVDSTRTSSSKWAERVMNEALGGLYELDVYDVPGAYQEQFIKAGIVIPIEWGRLFPEIPDVQIAPGGHFIVVGHNLRILAYNKKLVSQDRIPTDWSDCLDPHWKGKFLVDTRPRFLSGLYKAWGEERILQFAEKLKQNNPVFVSGQRASLVQVGTGEYSMFCGAHYASAMDVILRDPNTNLALAMPKKVPAVASEMLAVLKGARSPNAAILLAGWLASPNGGQIGYEKIGNGAPSSEVMKKFGSELVYEGWDRKDYEPILMEKITRTLGFPGAKAK
jgi:iron(III) transport system substrate-binding protein